MSVLISGDTGTGKELIVRAIHRLGRRRDGPLVSVSCSSLGEALFASEIFGHVRGAFTTLTEDRAGVFERAHGGTLLLDDVDGLPMAVQARLLSVLETGTVARLGRTHQPRWTFASLRPRSEPSSVTSSLAASAPISITG